MAESGGLPEPIAHSVDLLVESLSGLEVLIALYRDVERSWSAAEIACLLRITPRAALHELERLNAHGVAERGTYGGEPIFCYCPADPAQAAHVARIATAYATRRIETINHVASSTLRRIRPGSP